MKLLTDMDGTPSALDRDDRCELFSLDMEITDVAPHYEVRECVRLSWPTKAAQLPSIPGSGGLVVGWSSLLDLTRLGRPALRGVLRFVSVVEPLHLVRQLVVDPRLERIAAARNRHPGVGAVADLRDWLGLSVRDICAATGLAESTVYSWSVKPESRPRASTVSGLMGLWALAGTVEEELGERARAWWHDGNPSRLEQLTQWGSKALPSLQDDVAELVVDERPLAIPVRPPTRSEAVAAMGAVPADPEQVV